MKKTPFLTASAFIFSLAFITSSYAQEGVFMRQFLGQIGLLPEEKDPIDYKERPALVVPKDTTKLRPPEQAGAHTKSAQWPVDPHVAERKKAEERRKATPSFPSRNDPSEGGRLSPEQMGVSRLPKGQKAVNEAGERINNKDDGLLPLEKMLDKTSTEQRQRIAAGVEPPREFLTDPPKGLRLPDASAPIKRTTEAPIDLEDKAFRRPNEQ